MITLIALNVSIHAPVMDANINPKSAHESKEVSIHAPVMDANVMSNLSVVVIAVSIHAPVMDAKSRSLNFGGRLSFNPRARDGRESRVWLACIFRYVSIHAPVMDAKRLLNVLLLNGLFQSTRP